MLSQKKKKPDGSSWLWESKQSLSAKSIIRENGKKRKESADIMKEIELEEEDNDSIGGGSLVVEMHIG